MLVVIRSFEIRRPDHCHADCITFGYIENIHIQFPLSLPLTALSLFTPFHLFPFTLFHLFLTTFQITRYFSLTY